MRIYQHGKKGIWYLDIRSKDKKRKRVSLETTDEKLARAKAAQLEQETYLQEHFGKTPDYPFQDALLRYADLKQQENPKGYNDSFRCRLQRLLDDFGHLNVAQITLPFLEDYCLGRRKQVSEATLQREMTILKAILNKAFREDRLAKKPVFPRFRKLKGRTRFLSFEEEARLIAVAPDHLRCLIVFAIDTGSRRGEALNLTWENVSLERRTVTFTDTKNGEDRTIRISTRVFAMLSEMDCDNPKELVFTYRGSAIASLKTSFGTACRKAEIKDLHFHDLRHTFASRLAQSGATPFEIMNMTGHKSLQMVQRYAHLAPGYDVEVIQAMEALGQQKGSDLPEGKKAA